MTASSSPCSGNQALRPVAPQDAVAGERNGTVPGAPLQARGETICLESGALLRGRNSVSIQHNGTVYRLQATKLGKLILTK